MALFLSASMVSVAMARGADGTNENAHRIVYILPVKDVIDRSQLYVFRRGLNEAQNNHATALILDMDTPGGRVDVAEEILKLLKNVTVPTYTYVNPNAISAGAILAFSTDHIYMAPGAKIGDAMPIMLSPIGGIQEMPSAIEEKTVSYVAAMIRSAAQEHNHDPQLAEAMVRRSRGYMIGDEVICPTGQLLTLTSQDAERLVGPDKKPLLSAGTVRTLDELLVKIGAAQAQRKELKVTAAERLARWIEAISILLLAGGLLGLYIEFKTPGFGLPGILGIAFLAVWFWGHHIAGLAGMEEILLFIVGVALILVEVFIIPGFGAAGIIGIILVMVSLVLGMTQHLPGTPAMPSFPDLRESISRLGISLVISLAGMIALARFLPKTRLFGGLILDAAITAHAGVETPLPVESALIGRAGRTVSRLSPSGWAMFGTDRLQVSAGSDYIDENQDIVITEAHGNRIIVEKAFHPEKENNP